MKRSFTVAACWDEEAQVWYSESDIIGLAIEAETLEEFEAVMYDVVADLIVANHFEPQELATRSISDLLPSIIWQKPPSERACA